MAEVVKEPVVGDTPEDRRSVGRSHYLLWSLAAMAGSALVVTSAVQNVDELFGYVPPLFLLLVLTFVIGIGLFSSTSLAKNPLAALAFVAFPVTTLVYGRLALRMPGTQYHRVKPELGPYVSSIGFQGVAIVRSVPSTPRNAQIWAFVAFAVPI